MKTTGFACVLVLGIVLAGCGGKAEPASEPAAPVGVVNAGSLEDGGVVLGNVVDDSQLALANALVGLIELNLQLTTAED
ncbi:MAG TPA: hypothetical protein VGB18_01420, partial [Candidatus Thermoplasmatota archaeon]